MLPGIFRWATVVCVLWLLTPPSLQAQYPRARRGQFEVSGWDFRREGAWRKRVSAIRSSRHELLRSRSFSSLNLAAPTAAGGQRVTGRVMVPVIPIAFSNVSPPYPVAQYEELFFSPAPAGRPYSLKTFYEELSNGNITVDGRVFPWVIADSSDAYYEDGCNGIGVLAPCPPRPVSRFGQLLLRTLDLVSQGAGGESAWSQFDNDGPDGRPNSGDDDGYVDFVTFLQADRDGACPNSPHIWAHRFVIRAWNGGSPYVTRTPWVGHPGQFIKVDDYIMQSAVGGTTACDASSIMPIGTVAHETGHAFGLPDLYDTDLGNPLSTQGIGEWGLMGSGNYARPYSPARFEAWSLFELGWVAVDTLASGREVRLSPVASSDTVLYLGIPGTDEFYLFENRQPQESDTAQMDPSFGARQKSPGLLVWHIDQGQIEEHGFFGDNRVNAGQIHGVALVQADGRNELREPGGGNRGDRGDAFPGSSGNTSLCRTTNPAATNNEGEFARFCIDRISQVSSGGAMSFRYVSWRSVFAAGQEGAAIRVNGSSVTRLEHFFQPGVAITLDVDSTQLDQSARTRFDFLSWSNGGARTHTIFAREVPDTITAELAVAHRLKVAAQGADLSTVQTDVNGDVAGGVYLSLGSRVELRAEAPAGAVFAGWSGDTTASGESLSLIMQRPFDLMANFVAVNEVSLDQAAAALLGIAALDQEESMYLDAVGNRNGKYDLGDFLAASDRSKKLP
ncbi:MAG TPA: M6 family metalloprotease domain-containing protein [Gemmatimonadales bacterium]|nr:M6 family metalloprotease domain-containing protein [Gemmatimonadales bacterium]